MLTTRSLKVSNPILYVAYLRRFVYDDSGSELVVVLADTGGRGVGKNVGNIKCKIKHE